MFLEIDRWLRKKYNSSRIVRYFVNHLKNSFIFWRYRHFFHKNIWYTYLNSYNDKRRNYYSYIVKKYSLKYIFEFGCASGPNLMNINKNFSNNVFLVGFDINKSAINMAKNNFNYQNSKFINNLNKRLIIRILKSFQVDRFDISIFDRVLFLLNEKEVRKHFETFSKYYSYILIDDFYNEKMKSSDGYFTKDYVKILNEYNFTCLEISKSEHKINSPFFDKYAKRILLKNNFQN